MSLKTYFAARAIKQHLRDNYTDIELGPVSYSPQGSPERRPDDTVSTPAAHFAADFKAVSRKDGKQVQGGILYVPNFGGSPSFLENTDGVSYAAIGSGILSTITPGHQ